MLSPQIDKKANRLSTMEDADNIKYVFPLLKGIVNHHIINIYVIPRQNYTTIKTISMS